MLKYPCLILDHDDTVVQSEATVNYPYFCYILDRFRPGAKISLNEYTQGCYDPGFTEMCRIKYAFTEEEMAEEYAGWKEYVARHIPDPYPGIRRLIHRQKEEGGIICVVSHSTKQVILRDYNAHFQIQPDQIFGWDLPEHQRKPAPYPLEQIMQIYHLQPNQLFVVDDMKPAWEMASAVHVPIGFAAWSKQAHPQILSEMSALCDYTFHTVAQLEQFLFN